MTIKQLREKCHPYMKVKPDEEYKYEEFWKLNYYVSGTYDSEEHFKLLNNELLKQEQFWKANRLFYLALPPTVFETVTVHIRNVCMGQK